jgi:hypothetical protein
MDRFVLHYEGEGPKPAADVERIRALPDTDVLDEARSTLLIQAPEEAVDQLAKTLPRWFVTRERPVKRPATQKRVRRARS